jgi:hypothetical protein
MNPPLQRVVDHGEAPAVTPPSPTGFLPSASGFMLPASVLVAATAC